MPLRVRRSVGRTSSIDIGLHVELVVLNSCAQAVRDQMRKLAVGGPANAQDEKTSIYEVSDSEDEDEDNEGK